MFKTIKTAIAIMLFYAAATVGSLAGMDACMRLHDRIEEKIENRKETTEKEDFDF